MTGQGAPRADTGGQLRDCPRKIVAASSQRIEARGMNHRMARNAQGIATMLIRGNKDDVRGIGVGHFFILRYQTVLSGDE